MFGNTIIGTYNFGEPPWPVVCCSEALKMACHWLSDLIALIQDIGYVDVEYVQVCSWGGYDEKIICVYFIILAFWVSDLTIKTPPNICLKKKRQKRETCDLWWNVFHWTVDCGKHFRNWVQEAFLRFFIIALRA